MTSVFTKFPRAVILAQTAAQSLQRQRLEPHKAILTSMLHLMESQAARGYMSVSLYTDFSEPVQTYLKGLGYDVSLEYPDDFKLPPYTKISWEHAVQRPLA